MYACFLFGIILNKYYPIFIKHRGAIMTISILVYLILCWIFLNKSYFTDADGTFFYVKRLSQLAIGISASLSIILLMKGFERHLSPSVCYYGKETLVIYLVQSILLEEIIRVYYSSNFPVISNYLFIYPIICITIIIISVMTAKILHINKNIELLFCGMVKKRETNR